LQNKIQSIKERFQSDLALVRSTREANQLKVVYLGKKGSIQELMVSLKNCTPEERPLMGKAINDLKEELTRLCDQAIESFLSSELQQRIEGEMLDITLPGRRHFLGKKHPIYLLRDEIIAILVSMGFSVQYGPDMDSDYYNYEGLNFPPDHPARDMQDTFYLTKDLLLRSHTSNTQVRIMESCSPPIRVIAPGTVYRNETISARSHVFFHQIEGFYIDKHVTFSDLFSTMEEFLSKVFQKQIVTRFRPSYFPFVEPGVEVDIQCSSCSGAGCRLCKHTGWLEIAGAGMIHPEVLKNGGIDPEVYSGYAWGMGVERLAMLLYGVKDIRAFTENDLRFLEQF
jgi:phenylalanyl-tRNA synthetase alpha chain